VTVTSLVGEERARPVSESAAAAALGFDASPDASAVLDQDANISATNFAWRMFCADNDGSTDTTDIGVNYLAVCDRSAAAGDDDARRVATAMRAVLAGTQMHAELDYRCPAPDKRRWFAVRVTRLPGGIPGALVSHHNLTLAKVADDQFRPLAEIVDPLTGLATQSVLNNQLTAALSPERSHSHTPDVGVIRIDVSGYGQLVATHGQIAADETLQALADRLRAAAGRAQTVARVGRTTFAILAPRTGTSPFTSLVAQIERAVAHQHRIHGSELDVPVSIRARLAAVGDDPTDVLSSLGQATPTAA
jgi:diguanylate cyclase (GGDEF)-like protein